MLIQKNKMIIVAETRYIRTVHIQLIKPTLQNNIWGYIVGKSWKYKIGQEENSPKPSPLYYVYVIDENGNRVGNFRSYQSRADALEMFNETVLYYQSEQYKEENGKQVPTNEELRSKLQNLGYLRYDRWGTSWISNPLP